MTLLPAPQIASQPILTCEQARAFEELFFKGDEEHEWLAMNRAGQALAAAVLADFQELGRFPADARILVLAGKGHNGGDALIAAEAILRRYPQASVDVLFVYGEGCLRPLAQRAWRRLFEAGRDRIRILLAKRLPDSSDYALCLDGIFGFQFRPPLDLQTSSMIAWSARCQIRLRAAVDLPSGLDAPGAFQADFTYATGILKTPLLACPHAGRLRYLDLGFFGGATPAPSSRERVLDPCLLAPLRRLRPSQSDKRSFGHVFVLGGSRQMPGALLMSVLAALRSGAGLVTAFVPESFAATFAAQAPEAMWVPWPETPEGGLALEGYHLLQEKVGRATALVLGPGLGREPETLALAERIIRGASTPLVLDADALQPGLIRAGTAPRILTPHAGEFLRISGGESPEAFSRSRTDTTLILKGPVTRVSRGGLCYHALCGGPVLARGGSGDVLAGLVGGLLAQEPMDTLGAAARGILWHGRAADLLARRLGQVPARTTELINSLPEALRADWDE